MNTTEKKFLQDGTCVYELEFDSWRRGKEQMRNRWYASVQGYRDTPKEELEAVAKLFAAAPDLLEALQALLPMAIKDCEYWGVIPDTDEDIILARNAIAKATGESV